MIMWVFPIAGSHPAAADFHGLIREPPDAVTPVIVLIHGRDAGFDRRGLVFEVVPHSLADNTVRVFNQGTALGVQLPFIGIHLDVVGGQIHGTEPQGTFIEDFHGPVLHFEGHFAA